MVALAITRLPEIVDTLPPGMAELFARFYSWYSETGHLVIPDEMQNWVHEKYGRIETQQVVRVTNTLTGESTLYNSLRAKRPIMTPRTEDAADLLKTPPEGPFADPLRETPADTFGRIDGEYWITASNIAKYDYLHGLIISKAQDLFVTDEAAVLDLFNVAIRWCQEANREYPRAVYPFLIWNVLWRAGASVIHNHAQVLLTHQPYRSPGWMARVREEYRKTYGSEYYDDLFTVHTELGLGETFGTARVMAHLTPKKEQEVLVLGRTPHDLAPALSRVLLCYQRMGILSFNMAAYMPQLEEEDYYCVRLVNRGDITVRTSDIGGMEFYAGTPVVSADPYRLMEHLAAVLAGG
ncbi:hypothetical protein FGU65_01960 [Methanoculleus sp. FWC-SCC1]|uniref:Uncharacterized protein n=1 Tax=Methanoculleus frigidifontis TaxID=2584085 RepID=A0ABT8M6W9_9EURY|nr:hypothetical protein [Methanoculleus sp. FWC-SCC1]MDN7023673.1 hypothetical protein [Methanoculleus sp. FWC-SCC1]